MKCKTPLFQLHKQENGVTGLETAIILIAFVAVASVFALTVLSTGIFSAERGKETIHAGLRGARSSLELKGSIVSNGVARKTLSLGDTAWTGLNNVTSTADTTDKKEGTACADLNIDTAFGTGLVAYQDLSSTVDLSAIDSVRLWLKYGTTTVSGDLELVLDDSTGCGRSLENMDLPVVVGGAWTLVTLGIADNSDMAAIKCVGLNLTTDAGAQTANIDFVVAQGQATNILIALANALQGEPVDVSERGDSDADGISDSDSTHTLILTYSDKNQVIRDMYWTGTFIGNNDGDDLLEAGEKIEVNVRLTGLSNSFPVLGDTRFDIEVRP